MTEGGWGIAPAILDEAVPFHLVLDRSLTVRQVGSSLRRLCPQLEVGSRWCAHLDLVSPRVPLAYESLRAHTRSLFVLRIRDTELTLRGQMLHDEAADVVLFLGSPWVTSMTSIAEMGLTLEHFAVSDSIVDYLLLLQTQETALAQARTLADSLQRSAAELSHQALHDELTGLPNRRQLADRVERALRAEEGTDSRTGLLVVDLDGFKRINDTFGHSHGDDLLVQVGARLARQLRAGDTAGRLRGDEFAVLLPGLQDLDEAVATAEAIRTALELPYHVAGLDLEVTASVGVVVSGAPERTAEVLMRHAHMAMGAAKAQGVGLRTFEPASETGSAAKLVLQGELRRAIRDGELLVHYQPKVAARTGELCGVEALVRWEHPTKGMIPPGDFIPVAEHSRLIGPLTRHILDLALAQSRAWADAGRIVPVAVNISARNLLDDDLPEQVAGLLRTHGVPADRLTLEVTESALMTDPTRSHRVLGQLFDLGVGLAIDDFGAGFTSLGHLATLPVTELKIDRSFVEAMISERDSAVVVQSIITLGHNLGLSVVGEGVETALERSLLTGMGCDSLQGYHLCRPLPAAAFEAWADEPRGADSP